MVQFRQATNSVVKVGVADDGLLVPSFDTFSELDSVLNGVADNFATTVKIRLVPAKRKYWKYGSIGRSLDSDVCRSRWGVDRVDHVHI